MCLTSASNFKYIAEAINARGVVMSVAFDEALFYKQETRAINDPMGFVNSNALHKKRGTNPQSLMLNTASAYLCKGSFAEAVEYLEAFAAIRGGEINPFLICKYHLLWYKLFSNLENAQEQSAEHLQKALRYQKKSGSAALDSEALLYQCLKEVSEREITQSEEILSKAMKLALKSDVQELVLDVYLGYIQLYLSHNLPDQASKEIALISDMIVLEEHPLKYIQLQNLMGVMYNIQQRFSDAEGYFIKASEIAELKGYAIQSIQVYMNLGIAKCNQGDFSSGIKLYDKSLELLNGIKGYHLTLAQKVFSNKARALALVGNLDEAIALMQDLLNAAEATGENRNTNILRINLADNIIERGEYEYAKQLIEQATAYFQEKKIYDLLQNCHLCKARLYEAQADYQQAFSCMEDLYASSREFFRESFQKQNRKYSQRIDELHNEYFLLKNQCHNTANSSIKNQRNILIGEHPLIQKALSTAHQAAKYPFVNVHIYGESGTGKEIIARIIHEAGNSDKSLVAINASAISPNLIESELFGHIKGAFTGAVSDHKGKFLLANQGTLFLDEISDMPLDCQSKLLRALENHSISPVGSEKEISVHCRVVSASNRKLSELIRANKFRLDLYHRLNKVEIFLPPLRERISDLEMLSRHFIARFAREFGHPEPVIEDAFFTRLEKHSFPGNVRELMNIIERIFILKPKPIWAADQLDGLIEETAISTPTELSIAQNLNEKEAQLILNTLKKVNWRQKEAARLLGMTESTLCRRIKKFGLEK